jgi:Uma2 family endonuclease
MSQILDRPKTPARRRIDVSAYYKMAEAGILTDHDRVELIGGEIIDLNAIGSPHAAATNRLTRGFAGVMANRSALVSVQNPLRLDAYNEPEPDLSILRPRSDDYRSGHPTAADVLLVVEVSDTSLSYDRGTKLGLYARFGVPEVWIVDLFGAAVEVFTQPGEGGYAARARVTAGLLTPSFVPGVAIDITALLA